MCTRTRCRLPAGVVRNPTRRAALERKKLHAFCYTDCYTFGV